ncbi:MAG: hypothetical protein ACE10K_09070 [Rhodothermales bacterium]
MTLRQYIPCLLLALCLPALCGCTSRASQEVDAPLDQALFGRPTGMGLLEHNPIREASGVVASRKNPDVLWTHNDSGDAPRLYALNTRGEHLGVYTIEGAQARDWEDIALGPGPDPGRDYLYVGDIGDNETQYNLKYVYRVPEPLVDAHQAPVDTTLTGTATITLRYPDGRFDAETLLLDPLTSALYVITKRSTRVRVYRTAYPPSTTDVNEMEQVTWLTLAAVPNASSGGQGAVAGDISPSGLEVLVKTYNRVYYWSRASEATALFAHPPVRLPYQTEPQGEAIGWAGDGSGYFTLSEEARSVPATLYFYPRLSELGEL